MMDSENENCTQQDSFLKIVLLGEAGVGKTCLIQRYVSDRFSGDSIQTSGVEFHRKRILFPGSVEVTLHIWDTGGNALTSRMLNSYVHEAHVLIYMYDITNGASLTKLADWFDAVSAILGELEVATSRDSSKKPPFLALVGTKLDMQHLKTIKPESISQFAIDHRIAEVAQISAKTGEGVGPLFRRITATVLGLRLGRAELDQDIVSVQFPAKPEMDPNPVPKPPLTSTRSAVCILS